MDSSQETAREFPGFFRIYKDGRVERLKGTERVPPSDSDPQTGVSSKDIIIDADTGLSSRLYLPPLLPETSQRRPLLVYIHGGGFCIESAFSPLYHHYLNSLVAESGAVAVSMEYRLAPEHPVPLCYLDCWAALQWVARQSGPGGEPWLANHADLSRVFIAGDSAGANLAHHCAMIAGGQSHIFGSSLGTCDPIQIEGIILVHPFFWSSVRLSNESPETAKFVEELWKFTCPTSPGLDDPILNPLASNSQPLSSLECHRVLVAVAGEDIIRERGWWYYEALACSGWKGEVEVTNDEGEGHVFHLFNPDSEKAELLLKRFGSFINRE